MNYEDSQIHKGFGLNYRNYEKEEVVRRHQVEVGESLGLKPWSRDPM